MIGGIKRLINFYDVKILANRTLFLLNQLCLTFAAFMEPVYLSLGSNVGDREFMLNRAIDLLNTQAGKVYRVSAVYRTSPWGITEQPEFLNQVLLLETRMAPDELMRCIIQIEAVMGRIRTTKWGPRTIDIDILFYGDRIIQSTDLVLPHPFLHERRFILLPLAEIAPDFLHPILHQSMTELLSSLNDQLEVIPLGTA